MSDTPCRECEGVYKHDEDCSFFVTTGAGAAQVRLTEGEATPVVAPARRASAPDSVATGEAPAATPDNDWRLAEGAAPRREGDNLSPEEAIRLGRGHEPAATPGPSNCQKSRVDAGSRANPPAPGRASTVSPEPVCPNGYTLAHHIDGVLAIAQTSEMTPTECGVSEHRLRQLVKFFAEPPSSEAEEAGYGVKHLEPLRCQEYEDEIRYLREALGEIAAEDSWQLPGDEIGKGCMWCMDYEHTPNCPALIARSALAKGD